MPELLAEGGLQRLHRLRLRQLLEFSNGPIRIASAYVTDRELVIGARDRDIRLVTSLLPMDIASGATSLETLRALVESGVECRCVPGRPRLHAKVYIFGTNSAVVTSANLTESALDSNIEVGVELTSENVNSLIEWYDRLWKSARVILLSQLAELQQKTRELRRDFVNLKKKLNAALSGSSEKPATGAFSDEMSKLFRSAKQFFVCNTDRKHGERTATDGYFLEEEMYNRGYATAWESFRFPGHMEQVQPGDAVFMFAKAVGIVGVGRAKATCEKLRPGDSNRVYDGRYEREVEWRVPVHWLDWRNEEDAYPWQSPNSSFFNVSDTNYSDLRKGVSDHFLGQ